ncbi:MAG: nucleotidyltransferase family protein [Minisyncoccia bacterium]|jgi:NDP-sugar pyrophosphorylase family protein
MVSVTKGVVLAGGSGTRLLPLTLEVPKPLITVKKTPLINYNLSLFQKHGVRDAKVIIRPSDRKEYDRWLREYQGSFPGMRIELVEEPEPMGTMGYVFRHLREWMGSENIFVTNGDDIKEIDLGAMAAFHGRANVLATVALMTMEKPDDCGTVLVKEDKVVEFVEKKTGLPASPVSAGMYLISPAAIKHMAGVISLEKKFLMFEKDFFPVLAVERQLGGFVCRGVFFDCGTFERWHQAIRGS